MAIINITEAAKLAGKSKTTLYAYINSGKLLRTSRGIDTSELSRVFGEFERKRNMKTLPQELFNEQDQLNEVKYYQNIIERLEKQLQESKERENKLLAKENQLLAMIERLQIALEHQNKPQQTTLERIIQLFKS